MFHPGKPSRSVWHADGVGDPCTGKGKAVNLPLGEYQRPAFFRVAVIHAEQDWLTAAFAPFLCFVLVFVIIDEPILYELHTSVDLSVRIGFFPIKRKDQLVGVTGVGGHAIGLCNFFPDPPAKEIRLRRRRG